MPDIFWGDEMFCFSFSYMHTSSLCILDRQICHWVILLKINWKIAAPSVSWIHGILRWEVASYTPQCLTFKCKRTVWISRVEKRSFFSTSTLEPLQCQLCANEHSTWLRFIGWIISSYLASWYFAGSSASSCVCVYVCFLHIYIMYKIAWLVPGEFSEFYGEP